MRLVTATLFALLTAGSGLALAQTPPAAGTSTPGAATTPAPAPVPSTRQHRGTTAAATTQTAPAASAVGSADEAAAKQKCGADPVVWVNPSSKVFHTSESRYYGKTKRGSFMCQKDATAGGYHAAKSSPIHAKKQGTTS